MILVTFYSVSAALYLQGLLEERGIACKVVPVPRTLSSSCGYAAEVDAPDSDAVRVLCDGQGVEWEAIYSVHGGAYTRLCTRE